MNQGPENALKKAMMQGDEKQALDLLPFISDINTKCRLKSNANNDKVLPLLHLAILKNLWNLAKQIAQHDYFDLLSTDDQNRTALHLSLAKNQKELSEIMVYRSPSLRTQPDAKGNTPLHLAAEKEDTFYLRLFLSLIIDKKPCPCEIDPLNHENESPLHIAAEAGIEPAVNLLLEHGANLRLITQRGYTPTQLTIVKNFELYKKLKVEEFPTLFVLAAKTIENHPQLIEAAKNPNYIPNKLMDRTSPLVKEHNEFEAAKEQIEAKKIQQRLETINNLVKQAKAFRLNH